MICEVRQTIFVNTPHGVGQVMFLIDYGIHHNTVWVIALKSDGSIKHYDSNQIKMERNYTLDMNLCNHGDSHGN
jgi:hypothetical protein